MIRNMIVTNHRGETLAIDLFNPYSSGFIVTNIEGLNPPNASINTTELVTNDGSVFNSARLETRNIVLTLKYWNETSIELSREASYKYFPIKKEVKLEFITEYRSVYIYGYVESNEALIFSDKTESQISIICPNPYFYSTDEDITIFSGTTDEFDFPIAKTFSATSTYAVGDTCIYNNNFYTCIVAVDTPGAFNAGNWTLRTISSVDLGQLEFPVNDPIPFSIVHLDTIKQVNYSGEIDTGILIKMHFLSSVTGIRIWNYYTGEEMDLDTTKIAQVTGGALQNGDDIVISTIKGSKYITLTRSGTTYNILNCLNKDADWFQLTLGENVFCYTATTGIYNVQLQIENPILIQGI